MIILNLKDGSTKCFDLSDVEEIGRFNDWGQNPDVKIKITGFTILTDQHKAALPTPQRFRRVSFFGEVIKKNGEPKGERLTVQADDVRIVTTAYYGEEPKMVKAFIKKIGKQMFTPEKKQ